MALHGNILRHIFPSPAAFGTTGGNVTAQVVAAFDAVAASLSDDTARSKWAKCDTPHEHSIEDCIENES